MIKTREVAAVDPIPEMAVVEPKTMSAKKSGGDPTIRLAYLGKLRSRIEEKKVNPNSRDAGIVVVRFTVDAKGTLVSSEVASSSGSKRLDDAALAAVARASPYPPFPDGIDTSTIVVNVPFRFITR
ncbi:MAG: TonB family protein [Sphingomonadales bacterium]|nr:TonB family protein [Sphingomonadales bacterium]